VNTPKTLAWGTTPFDDMSRSELFDWGERMLGACTEAREALVVLRREMDPSSLYWGRSGSGGGALAKIDLVIAKSVGLGSDATRSTLLDADRRLYAACPSARSTLTTLRAYLRSLPCWSPGRTGATALARLDAIVEETECGFDSESIYRSFYRYANDLYFGPELGRGWHVCQVDGCDVMLGHSSGSQAAPKCLRHGEGTMRPITWADLKPREAA